jgi:hypothetical protein
MRRVSRVILAFFFVLGIALLAAPSARAEEEPILLAKVGQPLSDAELDAVTGGELLVCGPRKDVCGRPKGEGPSSQIILWDEWVGTTGRPQHAPGVTRDSGSGAVRYQVEVGVNH